MSFPNNRCISPGIPTAALASSLGQTKPVTPVQLCALLPRKATILKRNISNFGCFRINREKMATGLGPMPNSLGSDKFCLKWNDFESNVSTVFQELREDGDFFDVTLACDGQQLEAHKVKSNN